MPVPCCPTPAPGRVRYLNRRGYDDLVRAQTEGHTNSVSEINKLMTLELIQRVLIERDYGT